MFVLRSAFWLTVGFLLVAPHGTDFGAAASEARDQAIAAGTQAAEQIIVSQVFNPPNASAVVSKLSSSVQSTLASRSPAPSMQERASQPFVFPMPRPAALG